jgi:chromosome segregation ATPase
VEALKKEFAAAQGELSKLKAAATTVQVQVDAANRKLAAGLLEVGRMEQRLQAATVEVAQASEADASAQGVAGLLSLRYFTASQATAERLAAALKELAEAKQGLARAQTARFTSVMAVTQASAQVADEAGKAQAARTVLAETEKQLVSVQTELAAQSKVRLAQQKEYALKQAAPAAVEKAYVAKLAPHQAAVEQAQAALTPLRQAAVAAKARLAEAAQPVEAKRQAMAAAAKSFEEAKAKWLGAQKALAAVTKEVPERDKNLVELARTIADLSPQVEPQRAKVKAAESAYLAKLPKRNVAQAK